MHRFILAALVAAFVLPAFPAFADFGAIAYDTKTGKKGWSWRQENPKKAEEVALSACGASECKIVLKIGSKACGALATTEDGKGWGVSRRDNADAARLAALNGCKKLNKGECEVRVTDCNK